MLINLYGLARMMVIPYDRTLPFSFGVTGMIRVCGFQEAGRNGAAGIERYTCKFYFSFPRK